SSSTADASTSTSSRTPLTFKLIFISFSPVLKWWSPVLRGIPERRPGIASGSPIFGTVRWHAYHQWVGSSAPADLLLASPVHSLISALKTGPQLPWRVGKPDRSRKSPPSVLRRYLARPWSTAWPARQWQPPSPCGAR